MERFEFQDNIGTSLASEVQMAANELQRCSMRALLSGKICCNPAEPYCSEKYAGAAGHEQKTRVTNGDRFNYVIGSG